MAEKTTRTASEPRRRRLADRGRGGGTARGRDRDRVFLSQGRLRNGDQSDFFRLDSPRCERA